MGNKVDLMHLQEVKSAELSQTMLKYVKYRLFSFSTSASSGENLESLFGEMLFKTLNISKPAPNAVSIEQQPEETQQAIPK